MIVLGLAAALALSGQIAYSNASGDVIVAAAATGTGTKAVVQRGGCQALVISPDLGRVLVVARNRLALVPIGGGTPTSIAGTEGAGDGSLSPDGTTVAFSTADGIFTAPVAGGRPKQLVAPPEGASDTLPQYSPDGKRVAFARTTFDENGDETVTLELVSSAGGAVTPRATGLLSDLGEGGRISFSPDGAALLYAGGDGLFSVGVASGTPTRLTGDLDYWPSYSEDGATIEFVRDASSQNASATSDGDRFELWSARKDGRSQQLVAEGDFETLALRQPAVGQKPGTVMIRVTLKRTGKRYLVRWTGSAKAWVVTLKVGKATFSARVRGAVHSHAFAARSATGAASVTVVSSPPA
jgi:dipeptidyl aminopeptidase/acylaminoacyl peptidase